MMDRALACKDDVVPDRFTSDPLVWLPWLEPLAQPDPTPTRRGGITDAYLEQSPECILLSHDSEVLGARTRIFADILYNARGGLPRAERELAATAASRTNGCIYSASVHARSAAKYSRNHRDIESLLEEGTDLPFTGRWGAIIRASAALSTTPQTFNEKTIAELDRVGLSDDEIVDLIQTVAFFNWANRLLLSLGEPELLSLGRVDQPCGGKEFQ